MSYALHKTTLFDDFHLESEEPVYKVSCGCQSQNKEETVSLAVFEQVKWERDVALEQLKELGYGLGEKIRTDEDCISREELLVRLDQLKESEPKHYGFILSLQNYIRRLQYVKSTDSSTRAVSEDCISRQAVLDLAKKGVLVSNGNYKAVCKAINELPSVDCDNCNLNYEQGNMGEQNERLNRAVKALERAMPGQEWQRGEVNLYKLGECFEEGFRKGLEDDRNKGGSKYF